MLFLLGWKELRTKNTPWSIIEKNFCGKIINADKDSILESLHWLDSLDRNKLKLMSQNAQNLAEKYNLDNYKDKIREAFG